MKSLLAAVVLCMPVVASGEKLFLEYQGTVSKIDGCPCPYLYSLGDPISGVLTIDTDLAPPDEAPGDPTAGWYWGRNVAPTDFITGRSHPDDLRLKHVADSVTLYNDWQEPEPGRPKWDILRVEDALFGQTPDGLHGVTDILTIDIRRPSNVGQLFQEPGDGLAQAFDVTVSKGTTAQGYLERAQSGVVGFFRQVFTFDLTHVSLGTCSRHSN